MNLLIDDQCLGRYLRGDAIPEFAGHTLFTTGHWYLRLCQAYFRSTSTGMLSRPFEELEPDARQAAERRLLSLPRNIGLLSMRSLAPLMAQLLVEYPHMNVLSREVLASAIDLDAKVVVTARSPVLKAALESRRLELVHLDEGASSTEVR